MRKTTPPARSAAHSSFVIERTLAAPAARVFRAWGDLQRKRQWSSCHDDWRTEEHTLDFRIDGAELSRLVDPGGTVHTMKARFLDIVPDERIVYVYEMLLDERRISVSLVTVVLEPTGAGTRMTFTEQVTFLDSGPDIEAQIAERREGTDVGLARLDGLVSASVD